MGVEVYSTQCNLKKLSRRIQKGITSVVFPHVGFKIITGVVISSNCLKISFLLKRHNFNITDLFFKTLEQKVVMLL